MKMSVRASFLLVALGAAALLLPTGSPGAGPPVFPKLILHASVSPADPFSDMNAANLPAGTKREFRRGETVLVTISGRLRNGYHTYPLTRRAPEQEPRGLSTLKVDHSQYLTPLYPIEESKAEFHDRGPYVGTLLEHEGPFFWSQEVYIQPMAPPGKPLELVYKVRAQVCKNSCFWEEQEIAVSIPTATSTPAPRAPELEKRLAFTKAPEPKVIALPPPFKLRPTSKGPDDKDKTPGKVADPKKGAESDKPKETAPPPAPGKEGRGLVASILFAIGGGFFALLTPCVFPMIPITVSYFLKQAEAKQNNAVVLAAVYSGTIVFVLTLAGLVLLSVLSTISRHYATNFILGALFLFFALSLLGMYDITLPSWLTDLTASREGSGGLVGTVFMALTFSIISFACVGPIYGGFIGAKAASQTGVLDWLQLFLSVLAFSVAFASPFFGLALFPSLLRSMPRAGSWMNSVKVVMGFLELAAVFKFLRAAELGFFKKTEFLTFDLCLGVYVALATACGLYLLSVYRLPHDHDAPETIGVPRLLFSLTFLALGLYLLPGMFKSEDREPQKPRGIVFEWVESFLLAEPALPTRSVARGGPGAAAQNDLPGASAREPKPIWQTDLKAAIRQAEREKKLIFIDFTGLV